MNGWPSWLTVDVIVVALVVQYALIGAVLVYTRRVAWRLRVRRNLRLIESYGTRKPW